MCKMMISPQFFFKFLIFWGFSAVIEQKMIHSYQFQSVTLYISGTVDNIRKIFGTQVKNNDISRCFFFLNTTLQVLKFLRFLLTHFNNFFNK